MNGANRQDHFLAFAYDVSQDVMRDRPEHVFNLLSKHN